MARIAPELLDVRRFPVLNEVTTRYADIDPNQHINNVAMAAVLEDSRSRFTRSVGLQGRFPGLRVMIVTGYYDYLAEAHYPAPLTVHLAVTAIGRTSFTLGQVAMQEGRACAHCSSVLVVSDADGPTPLPDVLRDDLTRNMLREAA